MAKNFKQFVDELYKLDKDIDNYFETKYIYDNYVDEKKLEINKCIEDMYNYLIKNYDEQREIEKIIQEETVLSEYVKTLILEWCDSYFALRALNDKGEIGERLISDIFSNIIVHYNGDFFNKFKEYGYDDSRTFSTIVVKMDEIVTTQVVKHHNAEVAWRYISRFIDKSYQGVFLNAYATNYDTMQMTIIMDVLRNGLLKE